MHYKEYVTAVETCFDSTISRIGANPTSWVEDHITYSLCDALQDLGKVEIEGLRRPTVVEWHAFKHRGRPEYRHGDLAVLVRYSPPHLGNPVSGVGFLEAKAAYPGKTKSYDAIDWAQLERISVHTRYSMLLLYNPDKIAGYEDNVAFQQFSAADEVIHYASLSSHACALQTTTAIRIGKTDRSLHPHTVPLSHQICNRYLRFLDLDTAPVVVQDTEGWLEKDGRGGARYLLVAIVDVDPIGQPPKPEINTDVYERIGSRKPGRGNDRSGKPDSSAKAA